jgi:hypothetical protein
MQREHVEEQTPGLLELCNCFEEYPSGVALPVGSVIGFFQKVRWARRTNGGEAK